MTVLWVLLAVAAVFWLLGRIRLGGWVQYDEDGLLAKIIASPFRITVFPPKQLTDKQKLKRQKKERAKRAKKEAQKAKEREKRAKQEAEWREKHSGEEPEKKGGALPPVLDLLPLVSQAAGGLKKRLRIDELTIRLVWASEDPAETALGYGRANAAMGMIWPLLDHNFNVKKHDLRVGVDFTRTSTAIMCRAALTIRLGQLVSFGLRLGSRFFMIWLRSRDKARAAKKRTDDQKQEA